MQQTTSLLVTLIMTFNKQWGLVLLLSLGFACGDDDAMPIPDSGPIPDDAGQADAPSDPDASMAVRPTYWFERDGVPTASYGGQTFRHVLIARLNAFIDGLSDTIDGDAAGNFDERAELLASFDYYFRFDDSSVEDEHGLSTDPQPLQDTWGDFASARDLLGKLAGQDTSTDHAMWNDGDFAGWGTLGGEPVTSPLALVDGLFGLLADNGVARASGEQPTGPGGEALPVYVTAEGYDLKQLIQKVLLMAITFSQGADDYLDDDVDGKGLLASHEAGDDAYTALEHAWDEAFGYYGAPADQDLYTADELASSGEGRPDWQGLHDSDEDGAIDLRREYAWGASVNAAKRDRGSSTGTTFGDDAFAAFVAGRTLIAEAPLGALDGATLDALRGHRDAAVLNWERAIAATVIHYINDVAADMEAMGTDEYSFEDHAKHWGELKGFAIGLQFNPRSPLHEAMGETTRFAAFHALVGDAPVITPGEDAVNYLAALGEARTILQDAYGFDAADVAGW